MSSSSAKKVRQETRRHLREQHALVIENVGKAILHQLNAQAKQAAFPAKTKASKLVLPWRLRLKISLGLLKQEAIPISSYKVKIIDQQVDVVPLKTVQRIVADAVKKYGNN